MRMEKVPEEDSHRVPAHCLQEACHPRPCLALLLREAGAPHLPLPLGPGSDPLLIGLLKNWGLQCLTWVREEGDLGTIAQVTSIPRASLLPHAHTGDRKRNEPHREVHCLHREWVPLI